MDMDGQRYTVTDFLGSGAYGCVYEAMDNTTNERVALKQMTMDNNELSKNVIREISILMEMDHENLVRLKRVFIENEYLYLVMECLDTNFKAHRKDIASKYQSPAIIKILRGVEYSHSRGVLHRDLKMENILLDKSVGRVKIADFGSARGFVDLKSTLTPEVTTVNYRAPEVLLGKPYSTAIDMWSVGCIFVEMVTNKYLFPGDSEIQVLDKIYSMVGFDGKVSFPAEYAKDLLAILDAAGLDLLSKLLQLNPDKRISAEAALEHEYLKHVDVTDPRVVFMGFSTSAT